MAAGGEDRSIPTGASAQLEAEGQLGGLLCVRQRTLNMLWIKREGCCVLVNEMDQYGVFFSPGRVAVC